MAGPGRPWARIGRDGDLDGGLHWKDGFGDDPGSRCPWLSADPKVMHTLAVILARAGSKGLPDKCVLPLCGQPVIAYTLRHAQQSRRTDAIVLTTDSAPAMAVGRSRGVRVIERPPELATDTAPVDAVVRHAVKAYEDEIVKPVDVDIVVILYGNIPVRAEGAIDRCVDHLMETGCDSVRTVVRVSKQHPDWLHRLDGDRMEQVRPNSIHRRQDRAAVLP